MNKVNLLPESHMRMVARRSGLRPSAVWGFLLLIVGIGWFAASRVEARQMERRIAVVQKRLNLELEQGTSLSRIVALHRQSRAGDDLLDDLKEPVPIVAILAALARAVPEQVVLNRLTVDAPNDARAPDSTRGSGTPAKVAAGPRSVKIELGGLAQSDREVVRCLSRVAEQPLFVNVKLGKSRHIQDASGSKVAFQITLEVPMNREFVLSGEQESHGH